MLTHPLGFVNLNIPSFPYPEQPCNRRECAGPDCDWEWCAAFWSKRAPLIALVEAFRSPGSPLEGVPGWSNWKPARV